MILVAENGITLNCTMLESAPEMQFVYLINLLHLHHLLGFVVVFGVVIVVVVVGVVVVLLQNSVHLLVVR